MVVRKIVQEPVGIPDYPFLRTQQECGVRIDTTHYSTSAITRFQDSERLIAFRELETIDTGIDAGSQHIDPIVGGEHTMRVEYGQSACSMTMI